MATEQIETPLTRRIAAWMREHNATYRTFAALVGDRGGCVSTQGAWQWGTGRKRPSVRNQKALARIFGCAERDVLLMSRGFEPESAQR